MTAPLTLGSLTINRLGFGAMRITGAGVKRIKGDLVGDESYFNGAPVGSGWEWDDLTWSYGAQVSALSVNDNSIDITVKP